MKIARGELALNNISGWTHIEQERSGFKPRRDSIPWPLPAQIDWSVDPFLDRNWCFQMHALRLMDTYLTAYFRAPDPQLLDAAFTFVRSWADFHFVENRVTPFSWYDMAVGLRALRIGFLYNEIKYNRWSLTEDDTLIIQSMIDTHADKLLNEDFISLGNHGIFQVFGLAMMGAVAADRPSCINACAFADRMFEKILARQFTDEGVHRENSPTYHIFTHNHIRDLGGIARFGSEKLKTILNKAEEVIPWLVFPNGQIVLVGDSEAWFGGKLMQVNSINENPYVLSSGKEIFISPFWRSGYCVVQTSRNENSENSSMLFVMGMFYQATHKHVDDLSFELFEFGQKIITDGGKYSYNEDEYRNYFCSEFSHSVVGTKGEVIKLNTSKPYGSAFVQPVMDGENVIIEGSVDRVGYIHKRTFVYSPRCRLVILDDMASNDEHEYVSRLIVPPEISLRFCGNSATAELQCGAIVTYLCKDPDATVNLYVGEENPPRGWMSARYLVKEKCSVLEAVCAGRSRSITWEISFTEANVMA